MGESIAVGTEVSAVVKQISQTKINQFEGVALHGPGVSNIHTDSDAAKRTIA